MEVEADFPDGGDGGKLFAEGGEIGRGKLVAVEAEGDSHGVRGQRTREKGGAVEFVGPAYRHKPRDAGVARPGEDGGGLFAIKGEMRMGVVNFHAVYYTKLSLFLV